MRRARFCNSASSADRNAAASGLPSAIFIPDAPLASTITVSLVLMSPSTVMRSKLSAAQELSIFCNRDLSTQASVAAMQIIVACGAARCGSIIPAPLVIAPMVTFPCGKATSTAAALGTVSVVMMARAAAAPPLSDSAGTARSTPFSISSIGSWTPMRPVEATATASGVMPSFFATSSQLRRELASPCAPVQALATPELMATACSLGDLSTRSRQSSTGAAAKRQLVNTPANSAGVLV